MPKFVPVNQQFFDNWSPEMAYVLGFFAADGCLTINPRGSRYIEFVSTDREILVKIQGVLKSAHKIAQKKSAPNHKKAFRLQIGGQNLFCQLVNHGFTVNKSETIQFPTVPNACLSHFVRGYFDGDGSVGQFTYRRKTRNNQLHTITLTRFTSGSREFLVQLHSKLKESNVVVRGSLFPKPGSFDLQFAFKDSVQLGMWMYNKSNGLYLERKYRRFKKILGGVE